MKNMPVIISVSLCLCLLSCSCFNFQGSVSGNGNVVTSTREVAPFTEIEASGNILINVSFGEPLSVVVEADENLQELINTESVNGKFKVHLTRRINDAEMKTIRITVPELHAIRLSASVELQGNNPLVTDDLDIDLSSSSGLRMEVEVENLDIEMSSSSRAGLKGTADELDAEVSSSAELDAYGLQTRNCDVNVSSSGEAMVNVSRELKANASSSGLVSYRGDPPDVKVETSSSGEVNKGR